jgi:copper chaperone CopZ
MKNTLLLSILSVAALALSACDCALCTTETDGDSTAAAAVQASPVVITPASTSREFAFSVKGMHCGNCANSLTKAINNCDGVLTVNVSFADSRAVVNLRNADDLDCALAAAHGLNYVTGTPEAIAAASDTATP